MKIRCDVCNLIFNYPFEINTHKHLNMELEGVPCNFWTCEDYKLNIKCDDTKKGIFAFSKLFPMEVIEKSLGEGKTPLIKINDNLFIKDESKNPTGSFKDRGMPFLMNEVLHHKKKKIAICSTGNAAISLIQYARLYGIESIVFVPKNIDKIKKKALQNATKIIYSNNEISCFEDFFKYCDKNPEVFNGFLSTNISYLLGLETIAYELYYQFKFKTPDYIFIPCASGGNILSEYNAWKKLYNAKLINKIPKLILIQIEGGNPIEQGFDKKIEDKLFVINNPVFSKTILSTDTCFNYHKIYNMIKEKTCIPVSINDDEINDIEIKYKNKYDYTSLSVFAAYKKYKKNIKNSQKSVLIVTAKNRENNYDK